MLYFSKSRYCEFKQCPKACWLHKHKPEARQMDASVEARMAAGNMVGDLAMELFGDYVEVTAHKSDGSLDLNKMKALTRQYLAEGRDVICEASFDYHGLYCAVDILRKTKNGYAMYEVKSSTTPNKYVYLLDVCYQTYVLEKLGIHVDGVYIVTVNNEYTFDGTLDIRQLFKITDVTARVEQEIGMVEGDLERAERVLSCKEEPEIDLSPSCHEPYDCAYRNYCTRNLPKPSVFDLYGIQFNTALELYRQGIVSFADVAESGKTLSDTAKMQVVFALEDRGTHVDREGIKNFLDTLTFPLYFLDFESIQPAVPLYAGTRPYQQVLVQYSLHILRAPNGEVEHREFLGHAERDPQRELAERLTADIPADACVLVFNKTFENTRIKELAKLFPDLADHLLRIAENIRDLLVPFRSGFYYNRDMGGSFSIKSVLPAIFPDDPSLDYRKLEGVHNGDEAKALFPKLKDLPEDERAIAERNLLEYCKLDTFAMVRILQELMRVVS